MDPYVGEIRLFAGSYAPTGWAFCDGRVLSVQNNSILFTIIGNAFGGDGRTTFALPDLRGKVPVHQGAGPGLTPRLYASSGGESTITLNESQIPNHSHAANAQTSANETNPSSAIWAASGTVKKGQKIYADIANADMNPQAIAPAGGSQPHNNMQPYLGLNFIIALEGVYPPKS